MVAALLAVPDPSHPPLWYGGLVMAIGLAMLLLVPLLWWNLKKYQHDNFAFGSLQTQLGSGPGPFYGVFLKTLGVALLAGVAVVALGVLFGLAGALGGAGRTGIGAAIVVGVLGFLPLLGLTLKNWLLVALTLGLYWPFAAVALARIKLEAMSVITRVDPQTLAEQGLAVEGDAAGDAAGDLFGLDIGF